MTLDAPMSAQTVLRRLANILNCRVTDLERVVGKITGVVVLRNKNAADRIDAIRVALNPGEAGDILEAAQQWRTGYKK